VDGGRVAYVVGQGETPESARRVAYTAIDRLGGTGWRCRRDIAASADQHAAHEPARRTA
jgi:phosphoribosylamine-glycine ligase